MLRLHHPPAGHLPDRVGDMSKDQVASTMKSDSNTSRCLFVRGPSSNEIFFSPKVLNQQSNITWVSAKFSRSGANPIPVMNVHTITGLAGRMMAVIRRSSLQNSCGTPPSRGLEGILVTQSNVKPFDNRCSLTRRVPDSRYAASRTRYPLE